MTNYLDLLTGEDLTGDLLIIYRSCGIETVKLLLEKCPGLPLYIPKPQFIRPFLDKIIKNYYPGKSTKELAQELDINYRTLDNYMRGKD